MQTAITVELRFHQAMYAEFICTYKVSALKSGHLSCAEIAADIRIQRLLSDQIQESGSMAQAIVGQMCTSESIT